jgi:predicted deacylase
MSENIQKWGPTEKASWLEEQKIQRSYFDDVIKKIDSLREKFNVEQYGALSFNSEKYPLFSVKTKEWGGDKKTILITGGVHGYETSGVHGALRFFEVEANNYKKYFNIIVVPCVSP